jgi:hypothetical protein
MNQPVEARDSVPAERYTPDARLLALSVLATLFALGLVLGIASCFSAAIDTAIEQGRAP